MTQAFRHALGLALWCFICADAFAASDFLSGAKVAIVVGIAGDAETEKSYEDTLAQLLAALDTLEPKPLQVILVTDLQTKAPTGLSVKRTDATRQSFLALAEETNGKPLTVFAWGHGGLQGKSSVFHVRGPRLTPADFQTVANSAGEKSDWILMFTGSGEFTQALRHEGRRVLASENATRFNGDPIGMPLVAKALARTADFAPLAHAVGEEVANQYESRHLVRTEEPTLSLGVEKPEPVASDHSQGQTIFVAGQLAISGVDWTQMPRVKTADFPDEDGVILRKRIGYVLGESTAVMEEREEVIQVLTPEGKKLGDFDIEFSPPEETLEFLACEVLAPDGKVQQVDADAIREVSQKAWADYAMPSRKIFSMPGVVPGALLHVHYRRSWKHFPLPNVSLEIPLIGEAVSLGTSVEIRLSSKLPFHFALRGVEGVDPKIESREYSQIYRWEFPITPKSRPEPLIAANSDPALLISTFPDWDSFSGWYRRLIKLADAPAPELETKARELTADAKTETEKARMIYEFVTSLRYVAVPMGVNSMRPHAAMNVFRNRFGDCKDKANLYNTLLRTVGIQADLVLVPRFSQAFAATPGLAFNHAISRVKLDGQIVWADTTDDVCRFGLLPPGDCGRNALVINEETHGLTALPQGRPSDHRLTVTQQIELTANRSVAKIDASATGIFDYAFRVSARETLANRPAFPVLSGLLTSRTVDFRLSHQDMTGVAELNQSFEWRASGDYPQLLRPIPESQEQFLQAPFLFPQEWGLAGQRRVHPLFLNQGYPGKLDERIVFKVPAEVAELRLPPPASGRDGAMNWSIEWTKGAAGQIEAHCQVEWSRGELTMAETSQFQNAMERLQAAADAPVVVRLAP